MKLKSVGFDGEVAQIMVKHMHFGHTVQKHMPFVQHLLKFDVSVKQQIGNLPKSSEIS